MNRRGFLQALSAIGASLIVPIKAARARAAAAYVFVGGLWSVKDFGAVGDGKTDDTAALQAAIDAAARGDKTTRGEWRT